MDKIEFEKLFLTHKSVLERFVYYKTPSKSDGDDVLQEVAFSAFKNMDAINNPESFKPWILKIAANKCNDFYRKLAKRFEISLDEITENTVSMNRFGVLDADVVHDTLDTLADKDKQILFLYYFKNKPQAEIAKLLQIPIGTVKSRLYTAKQNFKNNYPFQPVSKGENIMKLLPDMMPEYKIIPSTKEPFDVKWEEMMGWLLIPKLGEKITWAMYDFPKNKRTNLTFMEVIGKASVHGIEGVEIISTEQNPMGFNSVDDKETVERRFIAQLTDTHCRILAESHFENGVKKCFTFLDNDDFISNWGFGENNCGKEVNLTQKGLIHKTGSDITCSNEKQLMDVVGRYYVEINGRRYDTVCLIDTELYNTGVFAEQYIDKNGKTVLWRRFNKNDWHFNHYNALWSEMMPNNERCNVNGDLYVHWYDCITDYII